MSENRKEFVMSDFGYLSERDCKEIKKRCEGTSMHIEVSWSNCAGNCTLILTADAENSEEEVRGMFIFHALCVISELSRRLEQEL